MSMSVQKVHTVALLDQLVPILLDRTGAFAVPDSHRRGLVAQVRRKKAKFFAFLLERNVKYTQVVSHSQ